MKYKIGLVLGFASIVVLLSFNYRSKKNFGGINLYTLREELNVNPKEILIKVRDLGYKNIEDAGYVNGKFYGMTPGVYRKFLDSIGLVPMSSHQGGITFENADATIIDLKTVGHKYLVVPIPPMGMFRFNPETKKMGMTGSAENLSKILNTLGKKCKESGLKLLYHNHDFEFEKDENGFVIMDYLLKNTDPEYVNFEIDLYWTVKAGADPMKYFEMYPGRFKAWHLKDMDDQGRFAPVGKGILDFAKYLTGKNKAGMEYYYVEQDMTYDGMTPLEAIKISHEAIKKLGCK